MQCDHSPARVGGGARLHFILSCPCRPLSHRRDGLVHLRGVHCQERLVELTLVYNAQFREHFCHAVLLRNQIGPEHVCHKRLKTGGDVARATMQHKLLELLRRNALCEALRIGGGGAHLEGRRSNVLVLVAHLQQGAFEHLGGIEGWGELAQRARGCEAQSRDGVEHDVSTCVLMRRVARLLTSMSTEPPSSSSLP